VLMDALERERGQQIGKPREKLVNIEEMLQMCPK